MLAPLGNADRSKREEWFELRMSNMYQGSTTTKTTSKHSLNTPMPAQALALGVQVPHHVQAQGEERKPR